MSGNPIRRAVSFSHSFDTQTVGIGPAAEIVLGVEYIEGPRLSDYTHVFTVEQARTLAENLLQSITDTEPAAEPAPQKAIVYPTPPADLAQHLYGYYPYQGGAA